MLTLRAVREFLHSTARFYRSTSNNVKILPRLISAQRRGLCQARHCTITQKYPLRSLSTTTDTLGADSLLDNAQYDRICTETLDALCDYFEELTENAAHLQGSDVAYGDGVLTVKLGTDHGTYVINRQTPNKQIWLSSPTSGPKRYDFVGMPTTAKGKWVYKHTGESLHDLLQVEIAQIFKTQVNFNELPFSK